MPRSPRLTPDSLAVCLPDCDTAHRPPRDELAPRSHPKVSACSLRLCHAVTLAPDSQKQQGLHREQTTPITAFPTLSNQSGFLDCTFDCGTPPALSFSLIVTLQINAACNYHPDYFPPSLRPNRSRRAGATS